MNENGHPGVAVALGLDDNGDASDGFGGREFLSRTDLQALGLPRRAVDAVFGHVPVIAFPGYSRPFVRRDDFEAFVAEHTFDGKTRVRP